MGFFGKSWAEQKIEAIEGSMQELTRHLLETKNENYNLHAWINYLNAESIKQQHLTQEIAEKLKNAPLSKVEIKELIDSHYAFDHIIGRIKHIEQKIDILSALKTQPAPQTAPVEAEVAHPAIQQLRVRASPIFEEKKGSFLKEQLVKRLVRNSKDYIKSSMISLIKKYGKLTAIQLRDIIVDEQALCSRSSFYRLLDELESEGQLSALEQGREKMYLAHLAGREKEQ
jgi:hypothetical protein